MVASSRFQKHTELEVAYDCYSCVVGFKIQDDHVKLAIKRSRVHVMRTSVQFSLNKSTETKSP